jgi:hypothetical protein
MQDNARVARRGRSASASHGWKLPRPHTHARLARPVTLRGLLYMSGISVHWLRRIRASNCRAVAHEDHSTAGAASNRPMENRCEAHARRLDLRAAASSSLSGSRRRDVTGQLFADAMEQCSPAPG